MSSGRALDHYLLFSNKDGECGAKCALPLAQEANSRACQMMLAGAVDAELDKQERICFRIPIGLREYAGLKKQTTVCRTPYNRIEIWDSEVWKQYKAKTESARQTK